MQEVGKVIAFEGDRAIVSLKPGKSCAGCKLCRHAQGEMLGRVPRNNLQLHDNVRLDIQGPSMWRSIFLMLFMPLAAMILGALLTGYLAADKSWREPAMAVGALAAAVIALCTVRFLVPGARNAGQRRMIVLETWKD